MNQLAKTVGTDFGGRHPMTVRAVVRQAFSTGLDEGGLVRSQRAWVLETPALRWVVRIDDRKWAGLAIEASLFTREQDPTDSVPYVVMFMETLPLSDTVERKQALYLQSAIDEDVRAERLIPLAREFAELIRTFDSIEGLREAEAQGWFSRGFVSPSFAKLLA